MAWGEILKEMLGSKVSEHALGMIKSAGSVVGHTGHVATFGGLEEGLVASEVTAYGAASGRRSLFGVAAERTRRTAQLMRAKALGHDIEDTSMSYLRGGSVNETARHFEGLVHGSPILPAMEHLDASIPVPEGHVRLYRGEGVRTPTRGGHGGEEHLTGAWYSDKLRSSYTYAQLPSMTATHGGGVAGEGLLAGFGHVRYLDVPREMAGRMQVLGGRLGTEFENPGSIKNEFLLPENLRARSRLIGEASPGGVVPEPSEILQDPKAVGGFHVRGAEAVQVDPVKARIATNLAASMDVRTAKFENATYNHDVRVSQYRSRMQTKARESSARVGLRTHSSAPARFENSAMTTVDTHRHVAKVLPGGMIDAGV